MRRPLCCAQALRQLMRGARPLPVSRVPVPPPRIHPHTHTLPLPLPPPLPPAADQGPCGHGRLAHPGPGAAAVRGHRGVGVRGVEGVRARVGGVGGCGRGGGAHAILKGCWLYVHTRRCDVLPLPAPHPVYIIYTYTHLCLPACRAPCALQGALPLGHAPQGCGRRQPRLPDGRGAGSRGAALP